MIEKTSLERMSIAGLEAMFENNQELMNNMFSNSLLLRTAGVVPEQAIDDLFLEMKQIWFQKLRLEAQGK